MDHTILLVMTESLHLLARIMILAWDAELKIVSDKFALLWGEAQLCLPYVC